MEGHFFDGLEYKEWIQNLKRSISKAQLKIAVAINKELLQLYWHLGTQIIDKEKTSSWGEKLIPQMAKDLSIAFPGLKGFSRTNLFYIKKWVSFYLPLSDDAQATFEIGKVSAEQSIIPQLVGQLPWGHHREIITHCKSIEEATYYLQETARNNWSRVVLNAELKKGTYHRSGRAINNFNETMPLPLADLARETLKNPYCFDFLGLGSELYERELERTLIDHIQRFLLELGAGFAYMGRQYPLKVGNSDFYLDLLFYHTKLRSYVVVELKISEFQPEFVGKLNFYLNAVDAQLKHPSDQPSLGLLLCKTPDTIVVDYALRNLSSPLGVSEYNLTKELPKNLQSQLPSIETIARGIKTKSDDRL